MSVIRASELAYAQLPGRRAADPLAGIDVPVSVRVVRIDPVDDRTPHRHPHSLEVVQVLAGRGLAWQEGSFTRIGVGDLVLIPAGDAHATLAVPGQTLELLCFFPHPQLRDNLEELDAPILRIPLREA